MKTNEKEYQLNPEYRFENFTISKSNETAYKACKKIANFLEREHNFLYIYGRVGLGKTHLLQSIVHSIKEKGDDLKVLYVYSGEFFNEYIYAIDRDRVSGGVSALERFMEKYCNVDVLLFDDLEFLIEKELAKKRFCDIVDTLLSAGKTIVISSQRHPKEIALDEKLCSQLKDRCIIEIQPPGYETRVAILKKYAKKWNEEVPDEVIEDLAKNIKTDVRELKCALTKYIFIKQIEVDN